MFKAFKIKDIGKVVTGKTPSSKNPDYFGKDYPFITPTDLSYDCRYPVVERYISDIGRSVLKSNLLPENTICFTCIGATVGKMCLTKELSFTNQQINSLIVDKEKFDNIYIYYVLKTKIRDIKTIAGGSATPIINKTTFSNFQLYLPNLKTQKKIASVLSTYDKLIENNTRRIEILEEMAQRIYKEWFVDFKYPGHENDELVDSELGMIPEDWKVKRVSDKFKTVLGGTPSRKNEDFWTNGTIPWINSSMVNELRVTNESELITEEALNRSSTKLMPPRTTLLAITGATLGQVSLTEKVVCANQSVVGVYDQKNIYNEYIYLNFCTNIQRIINKAGGGAQQHINKEIVNQTFVLIPKESLILKFSEIVQPIFDQIKNLILSNTNLKQTIDYYLPKLISGKVDVSDLNIDTSILDD